MTTGSIPQNRKLFQRYIAGTSRAIRRRLGDAPDAPLLPAQIQRIYDLLALTLADAGLWLLIRQLLLDISPRMEQAAQRSQWLPLLERAVQVSQDLHDEPAQAELSLQLGLIYQWAARWEEADACYRTSATRYAALGKTVEQALAINRRAYLMRLRDDVQMAETLAQQALDLLPAAHVGCEFSYFVLGGVAQDRADFARAEDYLRRSLHLCQQHGGPRQIAKRHRDLGLLLANRHKLTEAQTHLETATALFDELADAVEKAVTQLNLGVVYSHRGESAQAICLYEEAKVVFVQTQDHLRLAKVYHNQGYEYFVQKCWVQAAAALSAGIDYYRQVKQFFFCAVALDDLGLVYLALGQADRAYRTFHDALDMLHKAASHPGYENQQRIIREHVEQASSSRAIGQ